MSTVWVDVGKTIEIGPTTFTFDPNLLSVSFHFEGGVEIPQIGVRALEAHILGYKGDRARASFEHDFIHALTAECMGIEPGSPTLRWLSLPNDPLNVSERAVEDEEALVLGVTIELHKEALEGGGFSGFMAGAAHKYAIRTLIEYGVDPAKHIAHLKDFFGDYKIRPVPELGLVEVPQEDIDNYNCSTFGEIARLRKAHPTRFAAMQPLC